MMAQRGEHRAVLRGDSGHHSLKTPPISAYQGKSPCILGYQAQRPEKARNTFLAGQKGLLINGWASREDCGITMRTNTKALDQLFGIAVRQPSCMNLLVRIR